MEQTSWTRRRLCRQDFARGEPAEGDRVKQRESPSGTSRKASSLDLAPNNPFPTAFRDRIQHESNKQKLFVSPSRRRVYVFIFWMENDLSDHKFKTWLTAR